MGKLDSLQLELKQRMAINTDRLKKLSNPKAELRETSLDTLLADLEEIESTIDLVEHSLSDPEFIKLEKQNRVFYLLQENLSDVMNDHDLLMKILLIENLSVIDGDKKVKLKDLLKNPFSQYFSADVTPEMQSEVEKQLADIVLKRGDKELSDLLVVYQALDEIYETRKMHRYVLVANYTNDTIEHSTVLQNYMETTKSPTYKQGSLSTDVTRGIDLQEQWNQDGLVQIVTYNINQEIKDNENDPHFDPHHYIFQRIKDLTRERTLSDDEAKKANVLQRFAHQMLQAEIINEFNNKFEVIGGRKSSDFILSKLFVEKRELRYINSTLKWNQRVVHDTDSDRIFVEVDIDIPVISVNSKKEGDQYVCFDADKRNLQWIPVDQIDNQRELTKYKDPLVHLHGKAELVEDPMKKGQFYLKIVEYDVVSFTPFIKPVNLPSKILAVKEDATEQQNVALMKSR